MREDLLSDDFFGNEAGEDEAKERLSVYYLEKPENNIFFSPKKKLQFVRSRKGVGKSALLNYAAYKLEIERPYDVQINIKASELIALSDPKDLTALELTNWWQQRICTRINVELGKKIDIAYDDDSLTLVETSELTGFKGRNLLSALADRLSLKIKSNEIKINKLISANNIELLKRYSASEEIKVWLFIDDIDATFTNTEENKIIVSTFFTACRYLVNDVKNLNIRASVRTDVWTILEDYDEALDKCEQYMLDLKWSTSDTGIILANKILTYFKEEHPLDVCRLYSIDEDDTKIFNLVFMNAIKWGSKGVAPYRAIHILSGGRPRWAAQLCKIAARDAYSKYKDVIASGNINFAMDEYGKYRIADLYKEHSHQCTNLKYLIEIFRNGKKYYRTFDLLNFIEISLNKAKITIYLDGNTIGADNNQLAHFLYRIGFITLRTDEYNKALGFTRFEDNPNLLLPVNLNNNDLWEIHPSYRNVLNLKE